MNSYVPLMNDKIKTLGHFADQALQAASSYDFFRILCLYCILYIKRMPILQTLLDSWIKDLQDHHLSKYFLSERKQ